MNDHQMNGAKLYTTDYLAKCIHELNQRQLPEHVAHLGKLLIQDALGCMLGATTVEPGKATMEFAARMGDGGSTVLGSTKQNTPMGAVYANAQLGNILDFDDTWSGLGHPGVAIVSAALSVGERTQASGAAILNAIVIGYEVAVRIAQAIRPSPERMDVVHGQGTFIVFGAATAAALLWEQTPEELAHTLSLTAIHAPVPAVRKIGYSARPLGWAKNNFGWAAMAGMMAAELVTHAGFRANRSMFDGAQGFWVMAGSDRCDLQKMTERFGQDFLFEKISFKPYPCCRYIHPTIDACMSILQEHGVFSPEEISKITVRGPEKLQDYLDYAPKGLIDIQFSIPILVALALSGLPPGLSWIEPSILRDKDLHEIAQAVEIQHDPEADASYKNLQLITSVEVVTKSGDVFRDRVTVPKGDPSKPLEDEVLRSKFIGLAGSCLGPEKANIISDMLMDIEKLPDFQGILSMCRDL